MKFYVSSKFVYRNKVNEIQKEIVAAGHTITEDWTKNTNSFPCTKNLTAATKNASSNYRSIKDSDIFIYVSTEEYGAGSSTELGIALSLLEQRRKPLVYVIGSHVDSNIFFFHPLVKQIENICQLLNQL